MPKAVLGTGAGTVNEKVTILKKFKVETGREKQAVTVQSKIGGKTWSNKQESSSSFTNLEALDGDLQKQKCVTSELKGEEQLNRRRN